MEEKFEEKDVVLPPVDEPTVRFKIVSDRIIRHVISPEVNEPMVEISGYDLRIAFNMKYLKSIADVDAACAGISQLFKDMIMEELLTDNNQNVSEDTIHK